MLAQFYNAHQLSHFLQGAQTAQGFLQPPSRPQPAPSRHRRLQESRFLQAPRPVRARAQQQSLARCRTVGLLMLLLHVAVLLVRLMV
jgi:hypothetical protein